MTYDFNSALFATVAGILCVQILGNNSATLPVPATACDINIDIIMWSFFAQHSAIMILCYSDIADTRDTSQEYVAVQVHTIFYFRSSTGPCYVLFKYL